MKEYFYAKVIDNNDPDKEGKVQIYSESLMSGWRSSHYPWARAKTQSSGGSGSHGESDIPEVGTWLWCFAEKNHTKKNWYYEQGLELAQLNPHSLFEDNVKSTISSSGSYPDVKFKYYKNGICTGVSAGSSAKEFFVYHPSGTFVIIQNDGTIQATTASGKKIKFKGDLEVDGKIISTGNMESDAEIIWNNATTPTHASTHQHPTAVPGPPSPPTAGS